MNSEIIAFALGAKCGARERISSGRFSPGLPVSLPFAPAGGSASRWSCRKRCARANAPIPNADCERNSRRDEGPPGSIDMQELVRAEELLTETGEGHQLVVGFIAGDAQMFNLPGDEPSCQVELFGSDGALVSPLPGAGDLLRQSRTQRPVKVGGRIPGVGRGSC